MPDEPKVLTIKRVSFGSSKPEWYLYVNHIFAGYWSEYHDGPLPQPYQTAEIENGNYQFADERSV